MLYKGGNNVLVSPIIFGDKTYDSEMETASIGSAAVKLTDKILGYNSDDLADILKAIASRNRCGSHLVLALFL